MSYLENGGLGYRFDFWQDTHNHHDDCEYVVYIGDTTYWIFNDAQEAFGFGKAHKHLVPKIYRKYPNGCQVLLWHALCI